MAMRCEMGTQIEQKLLARNVIFEKFFAQEAYRLAEACREMSERFLRGGRYELRNATMPDLIGRQRKHTGGATASIRCCGTCRRGLSVAATRRTQA